MDGIGVKYEDLHGYYGCIKRLELCNNGKGKMGRIKQLEAS